MKIILFGGTTEGRILAWRLSDLGHDVTVSVATPVGAEGLEGASVRVGRLEGPAMAELIRGHALCIDATHPYAQLVRENIRAACQKTGVPLRRVSRPKSEAAGCVEVETSREAADYLADTEGNILLTTGAKELSAWAALPPERLFPRILPSHESLSACEALGIPHRNICAMQGPFSQAMNEALLRQYEVAWLVTKDGGAPGGFPEKRAAAEALGVPMIVLRRPEDQGESFETVLAACLEKMK